LPEIPSHHTNTNFPFHEDFPLRTEDNIRPQRFQVPQTAGD